MIEFMFVVYGCIAVFLIGVMYCRDFRETTCGFGGDPDGHDNWIDDELIPRQD